MFIAEEWCLDSPTCSAWVQQFAAIVQPKSENAEKSSGATFLTTFPMQGPLWAKSFFFRTGLHLSRSREGNETGACFQGALKAANWSSPQIIMKEI